MTQPLLNMLTLLISFVSLKLFSVHLLTLVTFFWTLSNAVPQQKNFQNKGDILVGFYLW